MWAEYLQASGFLGSLVLSVLSLVWLSLLCFSLHKAKELRSGKPSQNSVKVSRLIMQNLQNFEAQSKKVSGTTSGG